MKKGFFFSLDAFFAIMIFTLVLVSVYGYFVNTQELRQQYFYSEDLLDLFIKTKMSEINIAEINNENLNQLNQWNMINPDFTIMEQVVYFNDKGYLNYSQWVVNNMTSDLLSDRYGFSFDVQGLIYAREGSATSLVSRQRFVSG